MLKIVLLTAVSTLAAAWGSAGAQDNGGARDPGYPRGADAVPLLREIWDVGAESIYPARLAERFDAGTLEKLEARLNKDENVALADVLNPFLESLNVSHTRFYDRRHQGYYLLRSLFSTRDLDTPRLYTIGVQLDDREPGLVRAVLEGSPAAEAGLRRGDRIVAVDNRRFESLLQWQRPTASRLLLRRKGEQLEVTLTPRYQSFHRALARATRASSKVLACGDRRIGYLHLWSGTHGEFLGILKDSVADANDMQLDGFVLDLRDGYGGAWWPYLDLFHQDRDDYFTYTTGDSGGTTGPVEAEAQTNADAWTGPLAVITNSGTRSGKESLAFQFRKTGRATVSGSTTAGAFTAGRGVFSERAVDYILYLAVQEITLDGTVIEGAGVAPDVVVEDEAGRDAPLASAMESLGCP